MKQRLGVSPYKDRRLYVAIRITRDEAQFLVRDEGPGFNVEEVATNGRKEHLLRPSAHLSIGICEYEIQYDPCALAGEGGDPTIDRF